LIVLEVEKNKTGGNAKEIKEKDPIAKRLVLDIHQVKQSIDLNESNCSSKRISQLSKTESKFELKSLELQNSALTKLVQDQTKQLHLLLSQNSFLQKEVMRSSFYRVNKLVEIRFANAKTNSKVFRSIARKINFFQG